MRCSLPLLTFALLCTLAGCSIHQYQAAPIAPAALAQSLQARSLDDPDLRTWVWQASHNEPSSWPPETWDLDSLALAAYYFNPELDIARANAAEADAAITTAAMKPNPTVSIGPGYETAPESPFLMGFDFSLPIETAGKRGYRIATATHLSVASQLELSQTAWTVRSHLRAALVNYLLSGKAAGLLQNQVSLQNKYVELLQARFHAGEIPLPEVTAAQIDLGNLRQALRAAEQQADSAQAVLAATIGIPNSALTGKKVIWPEAEQPPAPASLPPQSVREAAVLNRLDVQRALAQYEAAQSNLQLEVARQYPDIELGPGYSFDQAAHFFSLNLSAVLPMRNRNEGPIAEAEAQRKVAGAQFITAQSAVIGDTDKALALYTDAYATLQEANRTASVFEAQRRTAYQLLKSGETDQLAAMSADIQTAVAERAHLDALQQVQLSLGLLEDALQRPISPQTTPALPKSAPR
jgi:cobalt-zinc-cadmium efflux system outer membrane protein